MRYASTYDNSGAPVVAELQGDRLIPLAGLTELGEATTAEVLAAVGRRTADAFPAADARLRAVVPNPAKVICVGLNYKAHIEETGRSDSDYPVFFPKFASSLTAANAAIDISGGSVEVDYEGELTVVIGNPGRRISEADAMISEFTTLRTGDLILTGTPSGVGHRRTPPLYLKSGDVVTVEVTGVGALRNTIA